MHTKRAWSTLVLLLVIFLGVGARLLYLAVLTDDVVLADTSHQGIRLELGRGRGTIYDHRLAPLTNVELETVATLVPSPENAIEVSRIFDSQEAATILERLQNGFPVALRVAPHFNVEPQFLFQIPRTHANSQVANHIIGHLDGSHQGATGIERAFNDHLTNPTSFSVNIPSDARRRILDGGVPQKNSDFNTSHGVVLSLDLRYQQLAEEAMSSVAAGAAVVIDIETGQIRASVSSPTFNPNNIAASLNDELSPFINRALANYNVGSTFKLFVSAAALEMGFDSLETFYCGGHVNINGQTFRCLGSHGDINMRSAIAVSCNIYFIYLAQKIGADSIIEMARRANINQSLSLASGVFASAGILPSLNYLNANPAALSNLSFGQGDLMFSPLHTTMFTAAIANNGLMLAPRLHEGFIDGRLNFTPVEHILAPTRVMSERTSNILQDYMRETVINGTGTLAALDNTASAGKTGSAQTGWVRDGNEVYQAWFTGFFPLENPRYAISVLVEDGRSGGRVAAPIFSEIGNGIFALGR